MVFKSPDRLLDCIESYFKSAPCTGTRIRLTHRAPIYLQEPGHSRTIVGLERLADGTRNLLTFDPSFEPSAKIKDLILIPNKSFAARKGASEQVVIHNSMKMYRRTEAQLSHHQTYEALV